MSLNLLLLDKLKEWMDVRVHDLTVDGELVLAGRNIASKTEYIGNVSGSLLLSPFTVITEVTVVGKVVVIKIAQLTVELSNQNTSGELFFDTNIPAEIRPSTTFSEPVLLFMSDGNIVLTRYRFQSSGVIQFYFNLNNTTFVKGTSPISFSGPLAIIYTLD